MKNAFLALLIFILLFSCKKEEANPAITESKVVISDNYAADGCELHILFGDSIYTSDAAGKKLVYDFVKDSTQNGFLSAKVILGYQILEKKDTVHCGWLSFKMAKMLKISYIKANK